MGRVIRRVLHRLVRGVVRARALVLVVLLVLVGGGLYAGYTQLQSPSSWNLPLPGPKRAPEATENYLRGQQTYNAELMWNSLSDDAADRAQSRGQAIQAQQRQLDLAREKGIKMDQISYVGGQSLPDGTSLQFYVVGMRGLTSRSDEEYVTYIFTLDRTGKIVRIQ